jgi:phage tail-like protein
MRDAAGQRFWMLADAADWQARDGAVYDGARRVLTLASRREVGPQQPSDPPDLGALVALAETLLARVPRALDPFGGEARRTEEDGDDLTALLWLPDGLLARAVAGRVEIEDLRQRWEPRVASRAALDERAPGFAAWRLAPAPSRTGPPHRRTGLWALEREPFEEGDQRLLRLVRIAGQPLPRLAEPVGPAVHRREGEDGDVVGSVCRDGDDDFLPVAVLAVALDPGERPAALATHPDGTLALVTWDGDGAGRLRLLDPQGDGSDAVPIPLLLASESPLVAPTSAAWIGAGAKRSLAVLAPGLDEAPVYPLPGVPEGALLPAGDRHPLKDHDGAPFAVAGLPEPPPAAPARPRFPRPATEGGEAGPLGVLDRLSLPSRATRGRTVGGRGGGPGLDSGRAGTVWHRLYVEACLPPGTGVAFDLAATDGPSPPPDDAPGAWHRHRMGAVGGPPGTPTAAWVSQPSELPFHPGLLGRQPERDRAGLWTVLVQRAGRVSRELAGRYLWVRAELSGDGRSAPEVAALRAWGPRRSWADRYLPEIYRERPLPPAADAVGAPAPSDFLDRFLALPEGVLTPLEDRVAASHLLTRPRGVSDESLEWLADWIGVAFEPGLPAERRRAMLEAAPRLQRAHGTLRGLELALDLVTDGGVERGDVVVVENFRLRRTMASILGLDLAAERRDDPVTLGLSTAGRTLLGDALILGEAGQRELLALFDAEDLAADEQDDVADFFDRFAHRVTVLVDRDLPAGELGLVRRTARREAPAHTVVRVVPAAARFRVGVAALVGVETRPRGAEPAAPVIFDASRVGRGDLLLAPGGLDPRLERSSDG